MKSIDELWKELENTDVGTWLDTDYTCPVCSGNTIFLIDRFDTMCCVKCNAWIEPKCSDPNCSYCATRPDTPDTAIQLETEESKAVWEELTRMLRK